MKIKFKESFIGLTLLMFFIVFYLYNEKHHYITEEAHVYLTIFIFSLLLITINSLEQHYNLNRKWKHFSRDVILVLVISTISTALIGIYTKKFSFSYLCISILFFSLIGKIYIQYKKNKLYRKRKDDLSIYNDKLKKYINIPLARGKNIEPLDLLFTDYGVLVIESTNIGEDLHPIVSELNYFRSNFNPPEWVIKDKADPSVIVIIDWIHGSNFKAKITFIDYERQETNGTILMNFSHLKKRNNFDIWFEEVKEEILYLLNNLNEIYKIKFIDNISEDPKQ